MMSEAGIDMEMKTHTDHANQRSNEDKNNHGMHQDNSKRVVIYTKMLF
jgi:hypothetical protein